MGIHRAASSEYQQQFLKTNKERINRIETRKTIKFWLHFFKHFAANWRMPKSRD